MGGDPKLKFRKRTLWHISFSPSSSLSTGYQPVLMWYKHTGYKRNLPTYPLPSFRLQHWLKSWAEHWHSKKGRKWEQCVYLKEHQIQLDRWGCICQQRLESYKLLLSVRETKNQGQIFHVDDQITINHLTCYILKLTPHPKSTSTWTTKDMHKHKPEYESFIIRFS